MRYTIFSTVISVLYLIGSVIANEAQWWQPTIENRLEVPIYIDNFDLFWGKCYDIQDSSSEVQCPSMVKIGAGEGYTFGTSGRAGTATGTEGAFDLVLEGGEKIATINFDCPGGGGSNQVNTNGPVNPGYTVAIVGFNEGQGSFGALGSGFIEVSGE
ncbi:uncharacterized protein N7446_004989 [Penicillium canescens]|uniref:Uncharacterized protein n=1 Tax=Penicillium canescens TaxID=5083 RepID=A0AAD6I026_PENCN|nr:uncharacterized protein N7446_004989 [Penicillium canescens]KAJ6026409.1 hypothetical protein N7460_011226 [Penicillium canescens]KAJ6039693.1 hypothetical protein N7444_008598 [Penicillium canescens]KAJ6067952.1 hypothetical protein N7446_004989 [Penicillium canescens]